MTIGASRPLLVGSCVELDGELRCTGIGGVVRVRASPEERSRILRFLAALDGQHPRGAVMAPEGVDSGALLDALIDVGVVLRDSSEAWSWFESTSTNPGRFDPPMSAGEAYALALGPLWPTPERCEALPPSATSDSALFARRRSLALQSASRESWLSVRDAAIEIGLAAVARQPDGHAYYGSAGGMYPVSLCVIRPLSDGDSEIVFLDPVAGVARVTGRVSPEQVKDCYLTDEGIRSAIDAGVSIYVVVADPRRVVSKYGNRGWRFATLEAGAVAHRLEVSAAERGYESRQVGGFIDDVLTRTVNLQAGRPLISVMVGGGGSAIS